jgi:aspartyl protease family protein
VLNGDQIANLLFLILLGSVISFWFFIQNRKRLNHTLQQAAIWGLIFLGVVAGYGLWSDIRQDALLTHSIDAASGEISVPRAPDGHYYLNLSVNGTPIRFVVDTGATDMVLTQDDARRAGVALNERDFYREARTANGVVAVAPVTLNEVALGPLRDTGVPASVNAGEMDTSLLGMRYLERFSRIEIRGNEMVLTR